MSCERGHHAGAQADHALGAVALPGALVHGDSLRGWMAFLSVVQF
jgi:hypothetical protein